MSKWLIMLKSKLDGEENRLMLMASGDFKRGFFTLQYPKSSKYVVP